MSGFEFAASVVASLAWPTGVVVAILLLRGRLVELLDRLRNLEAAGVKFAFDAAQLRKDAEVQSAVESLPAPKEPIQVQLEGLRDELGEERDESGVEAGRRSDSPATARRFSRYLRESSSKNPAAAVIRAGDEVEKELDALARAFPTRTSADLAGEPVRYPIQDLRRLVNRGTITRATANSILNLRRLRDVAVESPETVSQASAHDYVVGAAEVVDVLQRSHPDSRPDG